MAATVPFPGPTPLTPTQKIGERPSATLPIPTLGEGQPVAGAITNGVVPDNYYGSAGVGSTGTGMIAPITMSGITPEAVNATQGAVTQDDLVAVNGQATTTGKYTDATKSYSSTLFGPPPLNPAQPGPSYGGGGATGAGVAVATYSSSTTYGMNALVMDASVPGIYYQSLVSGNHANTPASSPTKWVILGPEALTQGPGGGWGFAIANPMLLPAYASGTTYTAGTVVGYKSVNSSYYIAPAYSAATTYASGKFAIGADNNVYVSLQAGNVANTPTSATNQGVYWDVTQTTWSATAATYGVGQLVLKDGVAYACASTVVSVHPSNNSTIWGSGVTITAWSSGATSASAAYVSYDNQIWQSLQASNTAHIPGTQTGTGTGVGWWAPIPAAPYDDLVTYTAGQFATYSVPSTEVTTLYTVQTGQTSISQSPRVNNQLQIDSTTGQDNLPATVLWHAVGYGVLIPYIYVNATGAAGETPDVENDLVGTKYWSYLNGGNNIASIAGDSQLARQAISYPPLSYTRMASQYDEWNMGSYFGPAAQDSPTLRTGTSPRSSRPLWSTLQRSRTRLRPMVRSRSRTTTATCSPQASAASQVSPWATATPQPLPCPQSWTARS